MELTGVAAIGFAGIVSIDTEEKDVAEALLFFTTLSLLTTGAVLMYKDLVAMNDPAAYLQEVWSTLLAVGQAHLATNK